MPLSMMFSGQLQNSNFNNAFSNQYTVNAQAAIGKYNNSNNSVNNNSQLMITGSTRAPGGPLPTNVNSTRIGNSNRRPGYQRNNQSSTSAKTILNENGEPNPQMNTEKIGLLSQPGIGEFTQGIGGTDRVGLFNRGLSGLSQVCFFVSIKLHAQMFIYTQNLILSRFIVITIVFEIHINIQCHPAPVSATVQVYLSQAPAVSSN